MLGLGTTLDVPLPQLAQVKPFSVETGAVCSLKDGGENSGAETFFGVSALCGKPGADKNTAWNAITSEANI
uniref:Uncharacterized protein n=1 Tax=Romanomermis culicivorax TaxID=13658 RepID=A0A915JLW8_ROMCU